jgi:phosphohistidine phosphatase
MRTLYLLRHAKSSWKDDSLRDFDRPLKRRGRDAAEQIGKVLAGEKLALGSEKVALGSNKLASFLVISSPAARARETTKLVLESAGLKLEPRFDERIYEADVRTLLEVVSSIPDKAQTAMLVGHNPGFENLLAYLTGYDRHMPTGALARIEFELASWSEVAEGSGRLESFVTPKDLADD